ncbi:hypothetical protein ALP05_01015 [Pseudomonas caricapapayae]|nr:hypothetical protein ALP05_01015 [Pseudomonas caricapapayae]
MSAALPYFFSDSLRARFTQDIQDAIDSSRISLDEGNWLRLLNAANSESTADERVPRADRLIIGDGSPDNAELAGALFISDPARTAAPVFLSTLAFGIERFESRSSLLGTLQQRFNEVSAISTLEAERIDGSLFEARTLAVMREQAGHLENLSVQLQNLPDMRAAAGKALQTVLSQKGLGSIDVFSQLLQLVDTEAGTDPRGSVVGTQYLADAAV